MTLRTYCCNKDIGNGRQQRGRHTPPPHGRVAMLSVHTCPLAMLGGKNTGGMNVYVSELSRELQRRGWAVDIFTHADSLERPAVVHMGRNLRVIHTVAGPVRHIDKNELYHHVPEFAANVIAMAEAEGIAYDVIHSHYWLSGLVAEILQAEWDVPIVQMFHTLAALKNQVAQSDAERELDVRLESERRIMTFADRLVAANPLDRQHMLDYYDADPEKITVVPCGIDPSVFHPIPQAEARVELGVPAEQKLILFAGRIEPLKGIDTLIRAVAQVAADRPAWRDDLRLTIIGGNTDDNPEGLTPEMRRLRHIRDALDVADVVRFLGAQPQETLPYFYSAADVVVVPSHYESFGLVALEAMACGTPVVASNVGGLTYTMQDGETGFLVPSRSPDVLADRIDVLLDNPALRRRMGRNDVVRARRFEWPAITDEVLMLYREVQRAGGYRVRCA